MFKNVNLTMDDLIFFRFYLKILSIIFIVHKNIFTIFIQQKMHINTVLYL